MIQQTKSATKFIEKQSEEFWNKIAIFEDAIRKKTKKQDLEKDAKKQFDSLGKKNLLALYDQAKMPFNPDSDTHDLSRYLIEASDMNTLVNLREFMRRRSDSIQQIYESRIPSRIRNSIDSSLTDDGRNENLKPFTRLLILFKNNPKFLLDIFYLQLWQSSQTYRELESDKNFPTKPLTKIISDIGSLEKTLSSSWSDKEVKLLGSHVLHDGTSILIFNREYTASIQRDFRETYNIHYRCGHVIFGFHKDRRTVSIRCGNSSIAQAIKRYIERIFDVTLHNLSNDIFSNYDPNAVKTKLLGNYAEKTVVHIQEVKFRRSSFESRCALSISNNGFSPSIQKELKQLREAGIIDLRSLDDLEKMTISLNHKTAMISIIQATGGAIKFQLDDAGWNDELTDQLQNEFYSTFGIPLNRFIDPQRLALGGVRVISFLLNMNNEDELQSYQQDQFDLLLDKGLIERTPKDVKVCKYNFCKSSKITFSTELEVCPECDNELHDSIATEIARSNDKIRKFFSEVFNDATSWALGSVKSFENNSYYPLTSGHEDIAEDVCVIFQDRLTDKAKTLYQRTSMPLIVAHTNADDRNIYLRDNIGYVSIPYLFSAKQNSKEYISCQNKIKGLLKSLLIHNRERITTAARHSYEHLTTGTEGDGGNIYETDIFNLLRIIFPYCFKIGRTGKKEPDGYVSVPKYGEDGNRTLDESNSWNWTYDAKHSDDKNGYDLDIAERRKIVDYINSIRRRRSFMGNDRKLRAHIIISNNLSDSKMNQTADYVFGEDGVKKSNKDVLLIHMKETFITKFYELFGEHRDAIQRRMPILGECFIEHMEKESTKKFSTIDSDSATELVQSILDTPAIDSSITQEELINALDAK